jgi:hypothetical protein
MTAFDPPTQRTIQTGHLCGMEGESEESGFVLWDPVKRKVKDANRNLLRDFLQLRDDRSAVLRFTQRWSVLGLCVHGLPVYHADCSAHRQGALFAEKSEDLIHMSELFNRLIRLGTHLANETSTELEDWEFSDKLLCGPDFPPWDQRTLRFLVDGWTAEALMRGDRGIRNKDHQHARIHFSILIQRLIFISQVAPRFLWNEKHRSWQVDLESHAFNQNNTMALLTLQLVAEIAGVEGHAICSNCQFAYVPLRKPTSSKRNYCFREACQRAKFRDAQRDKRQRDRKEGKLQ